MPLYEYECRKCHHRFEEIQNVGDPPIRKCPKCKKRSVQKLVSSPAVHFKGTGWYVTDYGRKRPGASVPSDKEGGGKETGGKEKEGKEGKEREGKEKPAKESKESAADSGARKDSGKKVPRKD